MAMLQNILGTYDASLGINDNQLSGVAIVEGATQSNATAMPYVVNSMLALNHVGKALLEIFPKIYKGKRSIPVMDRDGTKSFVKINQPGGVYMNYSPSDIGIEIEAGVNFTIAKNQAMTQLMNLMRVNPQIAEFVATYGLDQVIANLDYYGADVLEDRAKAFMQQQFKKMQQAQGQPNPQQMAAQAQMIRAQTDQQKAQNDAKESHADNIIKFLQLQADKEKNETDRMVALSKIGESQAMVDSAAKRAEAEIYKATVESHTKVADQILKTDQHIHQQKLDTANLALEAKQSSQKSTEE
jgi:hypothetical protein